MPRLLSILLVVYGIILALSGLAEVFMSKYVVDLIEPGTMNNSLRITAGLFGAVLISVGVWLVAAARDPYKHLSFVKLAITVCALNIVIAIYLIARDYAGFGGFVLTYIVVDLVFLIAFLLAYPWRVSR